jgi:hypothetical protein
MLRFALDSGRAIARMLADTQTAVACSETDVVGPLAGDRRSLLLLLAVSEVQVLAQDGERWRR